MKICPVCKSRCFDDMDTCYGCMYKFNQENKVSKNVSADQLDIKKHETQNFEVSKKTSARKKDIDKKGINKKENQATNENKKTKISSNKKQNLNEGNNTDKKILCNNLNLNIVTNNNKSHKKPQKNKNRIAEYFEIDDFPIIEDTNYFYKRRNIKNSYYVNSKKDVLAHRNIMDVMVNKYLPRPNAEKNYQVSINLKKLNDGGHLLQAYLPKIDFD